VHPGEGEEGSENEKLARIGQSQNKAIVSIEPSLLRWEQ